MEYNNELYHHGIKGMKWGVRRYQNKDGSLTNAGKKRRAKLEAELDKLGGKKSDTDAPRQKSVSEMSNKELQEHTARMQLEKNYYDAKKQLSAVNPKQVSKGQKFAEKVLNESIIPAVSNTTRSYLESYMKKTLGLKTEDELATLKKTYETLKYKTDIDKLMNPDKYMNYDERTKKYNLEKTKAADAKAKADAERKLEEEMKNYREYNDNRPDNTVDPRSSGESYNKSSGEKTYTTSGGVMSPNTNRSNESKTDTSDTSKQGSVEGVGKNSTAYKNAHQQTTSTKKETIDAEPYELMVVSNIPTSVTNRGQSYISGLLEEPKGRNS